MRPRLMNPDSTPTVASSRDRAISPDPALTRALKSGLGNPITALRASMESLAREFEPRDPRSAALDEALGEVSRLGRNVRDLIDYAYAPEPKAVVCSVDEILYSARFQLPHELWSHLLIARDLPSGERMAELTIDGPVLSRSLARLVQAASSNPASGILLYASAHASEVHFCVTFNSGELLDGDPMGLCHAIAQRDLGVIGCSIEEHTAASGNTTLLVRVPANSSQTSTEEAA